MAALNPGDRILLRDRPWRVSQAIPGEGHWILTVEALDDDFPQQLSVVVPPEEIRLLPSEDVTFDLNGLDSFASWSRTHRILNVTLVRETGVFSGARFGRVNLEAYQLAPVLRILSKPRRSLLIADDVGLGKTIEAGLVMLELMARGIVRRVLIVAPSGLLEQWQAELREKFGLDFQIIGNASDLAAIQETLPAGVSPWDALPRVITSIDYLKKETVRNRALRKRWDMAIVDEAHALAESGTPQNPYRTQRTRLGRHLQKATRCLLLLTATPHNGYAHAFRSLIELVEPTLATFSGSEADRRRRVEMSMIRRMKSQIRRRVNGREEPIFPTRTVEGLPVQLEGMDRDLLQKVSTYCSRTAREAMGTEDEELVGFAMQIIKKRALSSRRALLHTIEQRLEALEREEAREEPPSPAEVRDYQADLPLTEAQSERTASRIVRSAIPRDEKRRRSELRVLKRIQALLRKLLDRDPKIEALVSELKRIFGEDPSEKVIVFTEYRDTLDAIRTRLDADPNFRDRYVVLHGGLTRRERLRLQEKFAQPETTILLATDAASEGLNLQHHCRRIIHMELPWNPNRLEQRNGRVDRYGQTRQPVIRYLYYPDSPEDDVLSRLVSKIEQMAADYVSTPDILGLIQGQENFWHELVLLDPAKDDAALQAQRLVRIFEDRTAQFVHDMQPLLIAGGGSEAEVRQILAALDTPEPLLPDDEALERLVIGILGTKAVVPVPGAEGIYRIEVPWAYRGEGVEAVYPAATFRRSVAARTQPQEVEYITPLHPLVRALAADARRRLLQVYPNTRGLPPRRLAARRVPSSERPSILFTWLARIEGGAGILEEHLLAIRVDLNGQIIGTPEENLRWLEPEEAGEVDRGTLLRLFELRFDALREAARSEAKHWLARRIETLRTDRHRQAELLRQDLERDIADRLREIEEEECGARTVGTTGQLDLFVKREVSGFEARRAAISAYREERLKEIAKFEQISEPSPPQPLGALFLVPEGGTL